jgi:hypothetical protein
MCDQRHRPAQHSTAQHSAAAHSAEGGGGKKNDDHGGMHASHSGGWAWRVPMEDEGRAAAAAAAGRAGSRSSGGGMDARAAGHRMLFC